MAFPALALAVVVVVPAGALVVGGARPGTPRDLANSLAQTAIALVLVLAAAYVSGAWETEAVVGATLVAAGYLVGTVLVVRSVIRERGNRGFVAFSVGFHAAFLAVATVALPWPYAACAAGLLARAVALPLVERRRAGTLAPAAPGAGRDRGDRGLDRRRGRGLRGPVGAWARAPSSGRLVPLHEGTCDEGIGDIPRSSELEHRPAVPWPSSPADPSRAVPQSQRAAFGEAASRSSRRASRIASPSASSSIWRRRTSAASRASSVARAKRACSSARATASRLA